MRQVKVKKIVVNIAILLGLNYVTIPGRLHHINDGANAP